MYCNTSHFLSNNKADRIGRLLRTKTKSPLDDVQVFIIKSNL